MENRKEILALLVFSVGLASSNQFSQDPTVQAIHQAESAELMTSSEQASKTLDPMVPAGSMIIPDQTNIKEAEPLASTERIAEWIPDEIYQWQDLVAEYAQKYELDQNILTSLVIHESGGDPNIVSPAGAVGLMQVMPYMGERIANIIGLNEYDLTNPADNMELGAWLLRDELNTWGGDYATALMAYNGGAPRVNDIQRHDDLMTAVAAGAELSAEDAAWLEQAAPAISTMRGYSAGILAMSGEYSAPESIVFNRWKERGGSRLLECARHDLEKRKANLPILGQHAVKDCLND